MSVPLPLAVRLYNIFRGMDFYLTRWIEDFSFRHTAPGGCASCSLKLHFPKASNIDPSVWGTLYSRIQIIDTRSAEVLWEGRVEDPATQTGDNSWELGILGSSVAATDINMPLMYVDSTMDHWASLDADAFQHEKDDKTQTLISRLVEGFVYEQNVSYGLWAYEGASLMGVGIARTSMSYDGSGPSAAVDQNFQMIQNAGTLGNIDITAFDAATIYKANVMPTDLPSNDIQTQVFLNVRNTAANYAIASGNIALARFKRPKVIAMRVDRYGDPLTSGYTQGDFVYVHQVVEDVVGRFLNRAWLQGTKLNSFVGWSNTPWPGSVKGADSYIDTTDLTKIQNLQFPDGTNAKGILDLMTTVQTNAYWAIWESAHLWKGLWFQYEVSLNPDMDHQFRFEWARWPASWSYVATSQDGMQSQQDGEDLYNAVFMQAKGDIETTPYVTALTPTVNESDYYREELGLSKWRTLDLDHQFTRSLFVQKENPIDASESAEQFALEEARKYQYSKNTGTITISRPIYVSDSGEGSYQGRAGIIQPWEIRPGKLIKVRDVWPGADAGNFTMDQGDWRVLNPNPDFELDASGWFAAGGIYVRVSDQKFSGSWSGRLTPDGITNQPYLNTDWQPMRWGEIYTVTGWIRGNVERDTVIGINFLDGADAFISGASQTIRPLANTWTPFELIVTAPSGTAKGAFLAIMSGTPSNTTLMWLDEAKLSHYTGFPRGHENCVFRMAATTYNTKDNSCVVELDTLPKWDLSNQITHPSGGGRSVVL